MAEQNGRIHNQVAELLSAYIDDEVTSEERALVESHLATCTSCTHDIVALRRTVNLVGQLPQVPAPRPFTLRESDVRPVRPARRAWWQLPWARGLAAAAAMLMCVVFVAGVYLLGQGGMIGAPAAPAPVAMEQAAPAAEAPAEELQQEKAVVAEAEEVVEAEIVVETVVKEAEKVAEPAAAPPAPEKTTDEVGPSQPELPAEAPQAESEVAVAEEGEVQMDTLSDRAAAGAALTPTTSPAPDSESMASSPAATPTLQATGTLTPTLLDVEDLIVVIEPGVIRASGRLALPEGRKLEAELWRDGQLIEWAEQESRVLLVKVNGQFALELQALAGIEDFDLFAVERVQYEIRMHPVDPPEPVEIRIPFDAYGPHTLPPTSSP